MGKLTVTEVDGKVELSDITFTVDGEGFSVEQLLRAFRARGKEIADLERQLAEARKQAFREAAETLEAKSRKLQEQSREYSRVKLYDLASWKERVGDILFGEAEAMRRDTLDEALGCEQCQNDGKSAVLEERDRAVARRCISAIERERGHEAIYAAVYSNVIRREFGLEE